MTKQAKKEYVNEVRPRYKAAESRAERSMILDEMEKITRWHRKHLIRVLGVRPVPVHPQAVHRQDLAGKRGPGAPRQYDDPAIVDFLVCVWHCGNQPCGKRMKYMIPYWLPSYTQGRHLTLKQQVLLTEVSPATIDRLLAPERKKYRANKGRCTTKPGTLLLRSQIPICTEQWKEKRVGFMELDTVGHCGNSTEGQYVNTLDAVDLGSTWTELRATWGKGERGVVEALQQIEQALPFKIRAWDTDNGGEFMNHHLYRYLRQRKIMQTRSREYKKNDNAHVEQKNWTHVRQLFGYARFNNPAVVPLMNDLYANAYSLWTNFFLPSVKLKEKERIGSKIVKRHDRPQTPCERLLATPSIPEKVKAELRSKRASLNPFELYQTIQRKRKIILTMATIGPPSPEPPTMPPAANCPRKHQSKQTRTASLPARAPQNSQRPGRSSAKKNSKKTSLKNI